MELIGKLKQFWSGSYLKKLFLIYIVITIMFSFLTFLEVHTLADRYNHWQRVWVTTLLTPTGPFTGGACRLWSQGMTKKAVIPSLKYTLSPLLLAIALNCFLLKRNKKLDYLCFCCWAIGVMWWNFCGLVFILGAM